MITKSVLRGPPHGGSTCVHSPPRLGCVHLRCNSTGGRRRSCLSLVTVLLGVLTNCGDRGVHARGLLSAAGEATGLTDPASPPAEAIDLLCQVSDVTPCDPRRFTATLDAVASFAHARPSSVSRTWTVDGSAGGATLIGSLSVPERGSRSARRALHEEQQFVEATRSALCPPVLARLGGSQGGGVALAEALTKVSLAPSRGLPRRIVVLSSGYESAVARFRCRPLPTVAQWQTLLARRGLLAPGSLANTTVHFGYMDVATSPRRPDCATSTVARDLRVRELWRSALSHAGVARVTFDLAAPDLEALAHETVSVRRTP